MKRVLLSELPFVFIHREHSISADLLSRPSLFDSSIKGGCFISFCGISYSRASRFPVLVLSQVQVTECTVQNQNVFTRM